MKKKYLILMIHVILYDIQVYGFRTTLGTWKNIENDQKLFLK